MSKNAIIDNQVDLSHPGEARRLANILGVDAVVIGSVTDYTPYYPPRCGMRVEWYAANSGFHEIPPGYGLPWGTPEEEYIPAPLVFESEFALAKAQLEDTNAAVRKAIARSAGASRCRVQQTEPAFRPGGLPLPPPAKDSPPSNNGTTECACIRATVAQVTSQEKNWSRKRRMPLALCTKKTLPAKNCHRATAPQTACPHR